MLGYDPDQMEMQMIEVKSIEAPRSLVWSVGTGLVTVGAALTWGIGPALVALGASMIFAAVPKGG